MMASMKTDPEKQYGLNQIEVDLQTKFWKWGHGLSFNCEDSTNRYWVYQEEMKGGINAGKCGKICVYGCLYVFRCVVWREERLEIKQVGG